MDGESLNNQLQEMVELAESFFSRKNHEEGLAMLERHCKETLESVSGMDPTIVNQFPMYVAVGFIGKFQFAECSEFEMLTKRSSAQLLEEIRVKKALRVAESAHPAWKHLLENHPEALASVVALCFMAKHHPKLRKFH